MTNFLTQISIFGVLLSFLIVGLMYKKRPQTIKEYALGKGKISTPILMATMIATAIGGGSFLGFSAALYQNGLWFFIASFLPIGYCILAIVIIPRLTKYYGCFSISELIGKMYGKYARKVVGITAFFYCLGILGAQIKAFYWVMGSFFPGNALIATIIGLSIVMTYSSIGGVSSVIKTDVLQLFIFAIIMPLIASYMIEISGGITQITSAFSKSNRGFFYGGSVTAFISFFILSFLPDITPQCFHRFLIGRDTEKNQTTAYMLAFVKLVTAIFIGCVVFIALFNFTDLKPKNVLFAVIEHLGASKYIMVSFKIALIAVIVSTADSLINTGAIIFTHDILPKKISEDKKIKFLRSVTILSGILALAFACFFPGVLDIVIFVTKYYFIVVMVPFIGGLFIKNTRQEPFWSSVLIGSFTFTVLHFVYPNLSHEIFAISIFMSLVSYIVTFFTISKIALKTPSFSIRKMCDEIISKHAIQKKYLGLIILSFFLLSISLKDNNYHSQSREVIYIELFAGFLGILLFFIDRLLKKYNNTITLLIIWYCFSFFPVYVFLHQKIDSFFTVSFIVSMVLLAGLFSWTIFLTILLSGSFLAVLIYCLVGHDLANFLGSLIHLCLLIGYITMISYIVFRRKELNILESIQKKFQIEQNIDQAIKESEAYNRVLHAIKISSDAEDKYKNILLHEDKTIKVSFEDLKNNILAYFQKVSVEKKIDLKIVNVRHKTLDTGLPLGFFYRIIYSLILNVFYSGHKEKVQVKFCCDNSGKIKEIEIGHGNHKVGERIEYFKGSYPEDILPWNILTKLFQELEIQIIENNKKLKIKFPSSKSDHDALNVIHFKELSQTYSTKS